MKLNEIAQELGLKNLTPEIDVEKLPDISAGHASDLLSDVLAKAPPRSVLVTILVHINVIAVSVHAGLGAVIFASGMIPEEPVMKKAIEEQIPLYSTEESAFNIVGRLYAMGLRGPHA